MRASPANLHPYLRGVARGADGPAVPRTRLGYPSRRAASCHVWLSPNRWRPNCASRAAKRTISIDVKSGFQTTCEGWFGHPRPPGRVLFPALERHAHGKHGHHSPPPERRPRPARFSKAAIEPVIAAARALTSGQRSC